MEQLGVKHDSRVHSTRLKERVLAHFPDMREEQRGRDVLLVFTDDLGDALAKACKLDTDVDAVHLAHAAQIVRRHIIRDSTFSGFPAGCQQDSVPPTLLACMILEGPSIKHQSESTDHRGTDHRPAPQVQQREAQAGGHRQ